MMRFPDEVKHLEETLVKIEEELERTGRQVNRYEEEYMDTKRYISQFRSDPKEIFQNELLLKDIERAGISAVRSRERLEKLLDSPYFARIDFRGDRKEDSGVFYLGRFTFAQDLDIWIYDWRAPVAGMFYDCEVGRAAFQAPVGTIEGELLRKRQFKVSGGQLEYVLESAVNIRDDVLQRELASVSNDKMRAIIATIQREQNQIIRDEKAKVLIIQGVAGSGKTSVALHRIAYLLYRLKGVLRAENVAILSPNKVFADYIANVLPELGEEPVFQMGFEDLARVQLEGVLDFRSEEPWDEEEVEGCCQKTAVHGVHGARVTCAARVTRARRKASLDFLREMKEYLQEKELTLFQPEDYTFGPFSVPGEWLRRRYEAYQGMSVKKRLREIASDVRSRFETENLRGDDLPAERTIAKALEAMLEIKGALPLYRDFCRRFGGGDFMVMAGKKTLEWEDVYPFLYVMGWFEGLKENKQIRHLVIDEMQDYTPVQYEVINVMFRCQKTILGDFGQRISPVLVSGLDDLKEVYKEGTVVEMNTSYRCSYEIIRFAESILPEASLEPVERRGEPVELAPCESREEEIARIEAEIRKFQSGSFATMGILTKTAGQARELCEELSRRGLAEMNLIEGAGSRFVKGVSVASVRMAKGLEFDQVVLPFCSGKHYRCDLDRNLLYVACTRALHKLTLTWEGQMSALL